MNLHKFIWMNMNSFNFISNYYVFDLFRIYNTNLSEFNSTNLFRIYLENSMHFQEWNMNLNESK
jgi:hypothetical protein